MDQEIRSLKAVDIEVQCLHQTRNLETLLEAEVDMKKAAEANSVELTKELESLRAKFSDLQHEDDKVEKRCAEMDARLDALSIDFDEELYPHMLTAIASRLAVMKCAESTKLRQVFADVVSARIAKGMSEGLKHEVEHGKAYSSQLKIPVYPEVRDPRDPWAFKEEMLLEDPIMANVNCAEKKRKCWVVCRTHGIGSPHHPRSDGIPVSVPTVAPQGLAYLLTDAATQTETTKDEASPRLIRSKSLPPMYNLDWP
ncbi:hypothetical protein Tco_1557473 [Tanacetum coccineum]